MNHEKFLRNPEDRHTDRHGNFIYIEVHVWVIVYSLLPDDANLERSAHILPLAGFGTGQYDKLYSPQMVVK